jgi:hydroxymethylpyrimidine/phosphomethylpyrimidine kinase
MLAIKTSDLRKEVLNVTNLIIDTFPKNENLIILTEEDYNEFEAMRTAIHRRGLRDVLVRAHTEAIENDTADITLDEINAEIAAYRAGKRERTGK